MAIVYGTLALNWVGLIAAAAAIQGNACRATDCREHHPRDPLPTVPLIAQHRRSMR